MTREGELSARPTAPTVAEAPGLHRLGLGSGRDGMVYLPENPQNEPHPLIVLLHGAGADSHQILPVLEKPAADSSCALLVPDSRLYTWDVLIRGFGPDTRFLDRAIAFTLERCRIDPERIALAGFSDGASYALTLGVANGLLFRQIIAFSPGFMIPPRFENAPRIFMSHGIRDEVLSIDRCSRRILPRLQEWGYRVTYREFSDGHIIPEPVVEEAMRWFLDPDSG